MDQGGQSQPELDPWFVANQVRLWLFDLAYNLGNFLRRLAPREGMKNWSLTSIQTRLTQRVGRSVHHARRPVFKLAEVLVTGDIFDKTMDKLGGLRLAPR